MQGTLVEVSGLRHSFHGLSEQRLFGRRYRHVAQCGMRHTLGVVHHRDGVAVDVAVGWQILRNDLAPFAEADEDVLLSSR